MTAEMLHDAISLLPSDLITVADQVRSRPRKAVIQWRRWVSLAACAVLVLSVSFVFVNKILPGMGGSAKEAAFDMAAAECAPQEPAAEMIEEAASITGSDEKSYSDLDTITLTPTGPLPETEESASGSSANDAAKNIPTEGSSEPREAATGLAPTQYILTPMQPNSSVNISAKPQTVLIQSREALDAYYSDKSSLFDLASFYESCSLYDESWFESHDLLVLRLASERSEIQYEVTGFEALENCKPQTWEISLSRISTPEDNTLDENIHWHILLEIEKGMIGTEDIITLMTTEN